jgi:hypothetical protein
MPPKLGTPAKLTLRMAADEIHRKPARHHATMGQAHEAVHGLEDLLRR